MTEFVPVDHDPFVSGAAPVRFSPVDHDPFAQSGKPGVVEDVIKSGAIGVAKGGIGTAGMMGDIRELGDAGIGGLVEMVAKQLGADPARAAELKKQFVGGLPQRKFPTSQEVQGGIEQFTGEFYKPKTTAGKYAQTIGEFAPMAAVGPGGVVKNIVKYGVIPGVASEAAGQAAEGSWAEPYLRAGAAVGAGVGASVLGRASTAERAMRGAMPDWMNQKTIDQAQGLMQEASSRGVALTWPEALSQVSGQPVMTDLQRILESSQGSRQVMQPFMSERPGQINQAARNEFDHVAPRPADPSSIGPQAGQMAEGVMTDVNTAINKASEPFYTRAATVRLTPAEMAQVRSLPGYQEARDAVLKNPQLARYVQGLPEDSVGFLNEVKKYLDVAADNATHPMNTGANRQVGAGYKSDAASARQVGVNASSDYETALKIQELARAKYLDPLKQGPIGRLAEKDITTQKAIDALFPKNPIPNSELEIFDAVSALNKKSPHVTRQLVRAHLESTFENAANRMGRAPETAQFVGAQYARELTGNPVIETAKSQNVRQAIEASSGKQVADGFEKFIEIVQATGNRQPIGSRTAFNAKDLEDLSTGGLVGNAAKTAGSPGKLLTVVSDAWSRWQLGNNLTDLAAIITDPRSATILKRIANMPVGSGEAAVLAARLVTIGNTTRQQNMPDQTKDKSK